MVYSVSNNDSNNAMGPRSQIIPATNQWGRCGSIFDINCDGVANPSPNGSYDQRLVVRESQFSGAAQAGATYLFESWYLARQEVNILNSMGTVRDIHAQRHGLEHLRQRPVQAGPGNRPPGRPGGTRRQRALG